MGQQSPYLFTRLNISWPGQALKENESNQSWKLMIMRHRVKIKAQSLLITRINRSNRMAIETTKEAVLKTSPQTNCHQDRLQTMNSNRFTKLVDKKSRQTQTIWTWGMALSLLCPNNSTLMIKSKTIILFRLLTLSKLLAIISN